MNLKRLLGLATVGLVALALGACSDSGNPTPTCEGQTELCAGSCVDLQSNDKNCGKCGTACSDGEVCSAGQCSLFCQPGTEKCAGGCFDTQNDVAHCGKCDNACPKGQFCVAGQCATTCPADTVKCGDKCVDPKTDLAHCGAAQAGACSSSDSSSSDYQGEACGSGRVCAGGKCAATCLPTQVLCGGKCIDPQTDINFCGASAQGTCSNADASSVDFQGVDCPTGQLCAAGKCQTTCLDTQVLCGGKCVDPKTNLFFCGASAKGSCTEADKASNDYKGETCASGQVCSDGTCAASCLATQLLCGNRCADPASDNSYCGAKLGGQCTSADTSSADFQGVPCGGGERCEAGLCVPTCQLSQLLCNGKCVDPSTDNAHCGATLGGKCDSATSGTDYQGVACPSGQVCAAGSCQSSCLAGQVLCGGKCIDPANDNVYCGAKTGGSCNASDASSAHYQGVACASGQVCSAGNCLASCLAGQVLCGGKCIDPSNDPVYCGAKTGGSCDASASSSANYQGASCVSGQVCSSGSCVASCLAGQLLCGGKCIDPSNSNAYCGAQLAGACNSNDGSSADYQGAACASGQVCSAGGCVATCLAGQLLCGGKCVDPSNDPAYCGATLGGSCNSTDSTNTNYQGASCASGQVCSAGSCVASCLAGQLLCQGKCVDPTNDRSSCGAALGGSCSTSDASSPDYQGASCAAGQVCSASSCVASCLAGQVLCGGKCIDPLANNAYCGAALSGACSSNDSSSSDYQGASCAAGRVCAGGSCVASCLAGQVLCGGKCVDPLTDNAYCGATTGGSCSSGTASDPNYQGTTCASGQVCSAGSCTASCLAGQVLCGGKCIDPQNNNAYCGAATGGSCNSATISDPNYQGVTCPSGQVCSLGSCAASCLAGQVLCGGKCVDPQNDNAYCGAALGGACNSASSASGDYQGAPCASGQVCSAGSCVASCLTGQVLCGGKCIDPQTDNTYCGAALAGACNSASSASGDYQGATCAAGQVCSSASCVASCASGQVLCGGKCVDPLVNNAYCGAALGGACNNASSASGDYQGITCPGGSACSAGSCAISCGSGLTNCGGGCVDTQSNPNHCGGCATSGGSVCASGTACVAGNCMALAPLSCRDILAANPSAANGIYTVFSATFQAYQVYCDMANGGWTLIARFSNADTSSWIDTGDYWYDRVTEAGSPTDPAANADMISRAFWSSTAAELRLTRSDSATHDGLLTTSGGCLGNGTFRATITGLGNYRTAVWGTNSVRKTCSATLGANYAATEGFAYATCSSAIGAANSISFFSDYGQGDGAVMMIGAGGYSYSPAGCYGSVPWPDRADHGIAVTEANDASFGSTSSGGTTRNDFGNSATYVAGTSAYALNLWVR